MGCKSTNSCLGERGKGGGVKVANSIQEVEKISNALLGMQLITHQTGPEGKKVNKIFIEEGINIVSELYNRNSS